MDSFNPFANAWGDDPPSSSTSNDPSTSSSSSTFKLPGETVHNYSNNTDNLGFSAGLPHTSIAPVDDNDDSAWGGPIASTSTVTGLGVPDDEWSTAPSSPKPPPLSPTAVDEREEEDSWQPAGLSPPLHVSPPAWAVEEEQDQNDHSDELEHHAEYDEYSDHAEEREATTADDEEAGGFGGFSEALPDIKSPIVIRQDTSEEDRDWGATELPPSKWEEQLNAPPTWQPSSPSPVEDEQHEDTGFDGTSDPWRPANQPRRRESTDSSNGTRSNARNKSTNRSIDIQRISQDAEMDIQKLQSELGIQIRNLDEEYAKQGRSSPSLVVGDAKSPTSTSSAKGSRWSIWGGGAKKASSSEDGNGSRRASVDKNASATSPRSSTSTAGIQSNAASSAPQTPDVANEPAPSPSATRDHAQQQQQSGGVARFFRFGKGRATTPDTSNTSNSNEVKPSSSSTKTDAAPPKQLEITDDFSQLEHFDSKRSTSANGTRHADRSGYDDFPGTSNKNQEQDDDNDRHARKGWSFWNRNRVVDYSQEQDTEQDLDKVFSAFSDPPPVSTTQNANGINRTPSLRTSSNSGLKDGSNVGNRKDPFAHLSAAASSIRSSASMDPLDPLDPLAELNQAANVTSRNYKNRPNSAVAALSPTLGSSSGISRVPTLSPPVLAPPPSSSLSSFPPVRPLSSSSRIASSTGISNTPTPPPLLAPPPPLSSVSRKTSQPSLLDDLADLNLSSSSSTPASFSGRTMSTAGISSPASGSGPVITQAPIPKRPTASTSGNANILDDDFGDFETFSAASPGPSSTSAVPKSSSLGGAPQNIVSAGLGGQNKPNKANGPMKLTNNGKKDIDLFDLL